MTTAEKIKKQFEKLKEQSIQTFAVTVKSVDKNNDTCVVTSEGLEYPDARLKASVMEGKPVVLYPAIDSFVQVTIIGNDENELMVIACDEIESISITTKTIDCEADNINVTCDSVIFNNGTNLGMVKVTPLVAKLNTLEVSLNAHKAIYNVHTHPIPFLPTVMLDLLVLPLTIISQLANNKIKH